MASSILLVVIVFIGLPRVAGAYSSSERRAKSGREKSASEFLRRRLLNGDDWEERGATARRMAANERQVTDRNEIKIHGAVASACEASAAAEFLVLRDC
jgi:hypothetical protein